MRLCARKSSRYVFSLGGEGRKGGKDACPAGGGVILLPSMPTVDKLSIYVVDRRH